MISSLKPQPFLQTPPQLSSSSTILSPEVLPLPPVAHPHKSLLQVDVLLLFPLVWFTDCGMQCQRRFFPRICVDSFGQFKNGCDVEVSGGGGIAACRLFSSQQINHHCRDVTLFCTVDAASQREWTREERKLHCARPPYLSAVDVIIG